MKLVYAACGLAFALGLFFIFVWAPHPWGWEGFDHYHQLALAVASGRPFPTMEVPWGYAYFLACFYFVFGDRPWIPLIVQAGLNACIPLLVFTFARTWLDSRTAVAAALLAGVFSFNTVYVSTQSSDSVCTVVFMTALVTFAAARRSGLPIWYGVTGLLVGVAPQFRPNLILIPLILAAFTVVDRQWRKGMTPAAILLVCAAAALMPWVVRNYRLTGTLLPTSVHGGVQLWYGSLQVPPYLHSRAYNPRSVFDTPSFEYTSLEDVPLIVRADVDPCLSPMPTSRSIVYWTDRDGTRHRLEAAPSDGHSTAEIPAPHRPIVLYYYIESTCSGGDEPLVRRMPALGEQAPFVFFVSQDHLGDLDVHGDLLDVFDLIRIVRHDAWGEPLPFADALVSAGVDHAASAVAALTAVPATGPVAVPPPRLAAEPIRAALVMPDGSSIVVPREWSGRITDAAFSGPSALALLHSTASLAELRLARERGFTPAGHERSARDEVGINRVFYREEPNGMRRYAALALDNIRREPLGFALASAYRAYRVFVVQGSDDRFTAQQFRRSTAIYAAATVASAAYLLLFFVGAIIAWRRRYAIGLPLVLIAYVPLTICFVLTNMRYSITVQPLVFMFIAVALTTLAERAGFLLPARTTADREGTRTARQL